MENLIFFSSNASEFHLIKCSDETFQRCSRRKKCFWKTRMTETLTCRPKTCIFTEKAHSHRQFLENCSKFFRAVIFSEYTGDNFLCIQYYYSYDILRAAVQRCSAETVFLRTLQNSQGDTCA